MTSEGSSSSGEDTRVASVEQARNSVAPDGPNPSTEHSYILDGHQTLDGRHADPRHEAFEDQSSDSALLAKLILRRRRSRKQFLPKEMFGEPAWDMLLDLFIAWHDGKNISISSACIASGAPATTALRWLSRLETLKLVERVSDDHDRRRVYVRITDEGAAAVRRWLSGWSDRQG